MSLSQNYGVLRVVQVKTSHDADTYQSKHTVRWLPEERQVCLLTRRETTIGRALSNTFILMDPTVSREHARIVLDEQGWRVYNVTEQNVLYLNGCSIAAGDGTPLHSQDFLMLGNTVLQFIAPSASTEAMLTTADPGAALCDHKKVMCTPVISVETSSTLSSDAAHAHRDTSTVAGSRSDPSQSVDEPGASSSDLELSFDRQKTPFNGITDLPLEPPLPPQPVAREITHHNIADLIDDSSVTTEEKLFGAGITLQFAFSRGMRSHRRWLFGGIVITLLVLALFVIFFLTNTLGLSSLVQDNPMTLLSVLLIPTIAALGINALVNFIDRYEREPWYLRLAAFLWGAVIAISPTVFLEQFVETLRPLWLAASTSNALNALFSGLNAGVTEETFKCLGVLLLFVVLRDEFDNVTDGIVYGALIGAGFAMVENILYFAGNPKTFMFLIISRVILGWLNHSTFTIFFGAALGYIRHTRVRWQHYVIPLLGYLAAVSLHTAFDFVNAYANALVINNPDNAGVMHISLLASIGDYLLILVAQIVIIYVLLKALAHEARIIREFLTSEVSNGIVNVEEYALLQHSFLRARVERGVLWRYGFQQWVRVCALYQTEIGLAFRKWHVSMGDKPKLGYLQPEDAYRRRIQRLRNEILAAESHA